MSESAGGFQVGANLVQRASREGRENAPVLLDLVTAHPLQEIGPFAI
jgi:hypothetical protein